MEAVIIIDTLRRAGWTVESAGLESGPITASRGVKLLSDTEWSSLDPNQYDMLVLPGGTGGTQALSAHEGVLGAARRFVAEGKTVAAICAGPLVLQAAGILEGRKVTCHPSVKSDLTVPEVADDTVVKDGTVITSRGAGTAFAFALAIIESVDGAEAARTVADGLVL